MKLISHVFLVVAIIFSVFAQADTMNNEQLKRFARAIGIYEQIEEQKAVIQAQGVQTAQQYAQQITVSIPGLPDQFKKDIEDEMKVYISNLSSMIDIDFAVDAYIKLISKKLTATEIQKLTEFYESELGKKFTRSNTEIMGDWTLVFMQDLDQKMMGYLQTFTNNLMAKASSYNRAQ